MPSSYQPTSADVARAQSRAVGGARPNCSRGKSCSATCISRSDFCLVEFPASPAQALSKLKEEVSRERRPEGNKQLEIMDTSGYVTKEGLKGKIDKFKEDNQTKVLDSVRRGSKDDYERLRKEAIDFNKEMVRKGEADKGGLAKVPVTWEKLQEIKAKYNDAYAKIRDRMEDAVLIGDRKRYDKEERKLTELYNKLGVRVGDKESRRPRKGFVWDDFGGDDYKGNKFFKGIRENPLFKNAKIVHDDSDAPNATMTIYKKVGKHMLSMHLDDNGTNFSFKIDDSYDKPRNMSRRDSFAIAKLTEEMFRAVTNSMEVGSIVTVYPYDGDGRGKKRERAYQRFGFGSTPWRSMYGRVTEFGFEPASETAYGRYMREKEFNFAELSKKERIKLMYVALWGEDPK